MADNPFRRGLGRARSWGAVLPNRGQEGCECDLSEIKLKKGEPIDRALRRLKKKVERENTLKDVRAKRTYEKPSAMRRRKMKVAKFSAMLARRHADA